MANETLTPGGRLDHCPRPTPAAGVLPELRAAAGGLPPTIIIGMHRSGTTLLVELLEKLGFFAGWRKDPNNEALFFLDLNRWLLEKCGGGWDNPEPFGWLTVNPELRQLLLDYLKYYLDTPNLIRFLGLGNYLRYRSLGRLDRPWGWKDPRNTFTLDLWAEIFPDCRVVHIRRHGVDVAASLQMRSRRRLLHSLSSYRRKRKYYNLAPRKSGFTDSCRCLDLWGGLSLWETYLSQARKQLAALGPRAIEIKYEDLLCEPAAVLAQVAAFCGLDCPEARLQSAVAAIKPDRAFAHRKVGLLAQMADSSADLLAQYGY